MASVIPENYSNDYSKLYSANTIYSNLDQNKIIQNKIQNKMQQYLKSEEYNENTNDFYYAQYKNIFNITLGIFGLTYYIYSNFFSVTPKMIRGGRRL